MRRKRMMIGKRSFVATGAPKALGAAKKKSGGLAEVTEYGTARTVTLFVGRNKGKERKNRTGVCKRRPAEFSVAAIDREVQDIRAKQVEKKHVGMTRTSGRGFFKGDPEKSVAYEFAYIPPDGGGPAIETSFAQFRAHMDRLAEGVAEKFCQDEVLIVRDDGKRRTVAGAKWKK